MTNEKHFCSVSRNVLPSSSLPLTFRFCSRISISYLCPFYISASLITPFFHGLFFPPQQKPCTNPSIRPVSEVLWNVTLTPWVHSKGWFPASVCSMVRLVLFLLDLKYSEALYNIRVCVYISPHSLPHSFLKLSI